MTEDHGLVEQAPCFCLVAKHTGRCITSNNAVAKAGK